MEEALLIVEQAADDPEIINAIFRAAHTIKGSAGMFGIDPIVVFTHAAESVLDRVRGGSVAMSAELAALFIEVHDHLRDLINRVAEVSQADPEADSYGRRLIAQLETYLGESQQAENADAADSADMPVVHQSSVEREHSDMVGSDHWHISLRFGPDVFRSGMDPFSFVRCLSSLGRIVQLVSLTGGI
ncbi:MAG: Hpt domain-containing protein, partial [Methylobacter sp.]